MVFFDTTSLHFEGAGGQSLGQRGNSKDSRPDLAQMVVGVVLAGQGEPLCCEMWPGRLDVEAAGTLKPGQTVVELTSGNTGTGLAIVCGVKGYPLVAVMSKGNSVERARMMRALGAEVVLVEQLPGSIPGQVSGGDLERVEQETRRIVRERGAFRADQFSLRGNFHAHFRYTAGDPGPDRRAGRCLLRFRRHGGFIRRLRRGFQGPPPIHPLLSD